MQKAKVPKMPVSVDAHLWGWEWGKEPENLDGGISDGTWYVKNSTMHDFIHMGF